MVFCHFFPPLFCLLSFKTKNESFALFISGNTKNNRFDWRLVAKKVITLHTFLYEFDQIFWSNNLIDNFYVTIHLEAQNRLFELYQSCTFYFSVALKGSQMAQVHHTDLIHPQTLNIKNTPYNFCSFLLLTFCLNSLLCTGA